MELVLGINVHGTTVKIQAANTPKTIRLIWRIYFVVDEKLFSKSILLCSIRLSISSSFMLITDIESSCMVRQLYNNDNDS